MSEHAAPVRLRFDFPAAFAGDDPLEFADPNVVLCADTPEEVPGVLACAEALARGGAWVAGFVCYEAGAAFDPAFRFRGRSVLPLAWFAAFDAPSVDPTTAGQSAHAPNFGHWEA